MIQRFCLFVLMTTMGYAGAQPDTPRTGALIGEEKRVRDELDAADKLATDKHFDDAIRRYQQILAESGDALVALDPTEPRRSLPARWIVHRKIAALPPEARKLFRTSVAELTRPWLEQGTANRDVRLLEQIIAEAFCSAAAEQALHLLGDLAFERAEFEVAEHYWRMLARFPSETGDEGAFVLRHPDPTGDIALTKAKLILARLFRGDRTAASAELEHFRKQHSDASGSLAGRTGKFADIVQAMVDADVRFQSTPGPAGATWSTFAGDANRNAVIPASSTPYWHYVPNWRTKLETDPKAKPHRDSDPPLGTGASARSLAFHPAIVPGYVLVADAARVFAYDLLSGDLAAQYDHRQNAGMPEAIDLRIPSRTDASYTLSVAGDRIYARLGAGPMKQPDGAAKPRDGESMIVCLALRRENPVKLELLWQIRARPLDSDPASLFEGTPIVRDGRLYVGRTRFDGRQLIAGVDCYDADSTGQPNEPPARRWRQELWTVDMGVDPTRHRHDLLTLAGPNVICCTNSGAIVAVDAATGRRAWAYRYAVQLNRGVDGVHPRDLCPCVAAGGRIYAAPADSNRILCLDARTGERIWESETVHTVQLLGVSRGLLIATLGGFPQGIRAFDAARGRIVWTKPDEGDQGTFGRGFLSDRWVFWPTRHGLRVLRLDDGEPIDPGSSTQPLGHLALADGFLIVATPTEIWGFVPTRKLTEREPNAGRVVFDSNFAALLPSFDAETNYFGALGHAEAGDLQRAATRLRLTETLAGEETRLHGWPLRELARFRRYELLLIQAERSWKKGDEESSFASLRAASSEPFALNDRVRAWTLRHHAGDRTRPAALPESALHELWISRPDGLPQRADEFLSNLREPNRTVRWRPPKERMPQPIVPPARTPDPPAPWQSTKLIGIEAFREWPMTPFRDAAAGAEGPSFNAEGRFFLASPKRVICRAAGSGQSIWTCDVEHDVIAFGLDGDAVIVAGPTGVSRLRGSDGKMLWHFHVPDSRPMPAAFPEPVFPQLEPGPRPNELSAFRIAGLQLYCRLGQRRLLAFDLESGRPMWQFQLRGAEHNAAISPYMLATDEHLLLQSTCGELIALRAADGKRLFQLPAPTPWSAPPIQLDDRTALYADGPKLRAIDLATGVERWNYSPPHPASLAGSSTQVRRERSNLIVVVERNYGWELERLHVDGRRELGPIALGRNPIDLARSALNGVVYALHAGDRVIALDLEQCRKLWNKPLPTGEAWRLRSTLSAVILHPDFAIKRTDVNAMSRRIEREFAGLPALGNLQTAFGMTFHTYLDRRFPVLALSPDNGSTLHEQSFPASGPRAALLLGERSGIVVVEGQMEALRARN